MSFLMLLVLSGCFNMYMQQFYGVTSESYVLRTALRERDGACAVAPVSGAMIVVKSCIQVGSPGTTMDDHKTPYLVSTVYAPSIELAEPSAYQVEVRAGGRLLLEENGEQYEDYRVPNYTHDGRWYETTIHQLPEVPQSGDVYEITWMATYNTESWGTAIIAFQ